MKKNYFLTFLLTVLISGFSFSQDLIITGAYDAGLSGGTPKGVELYVVNDIADLSIYGIGSANNGGGTDGEEFEFPNVAVAGGTFIYVASEETQFNAFFGFNPDYNAGSAMGINGDDAVELFMNDVVIDVFGDIDTDGNGEDWEYLDGWAYRKDGKTASTTFTSSDWTYSGINAFDGETTNASAATPFPVGTYSSTASSSPSLNIISPSDGSTISFTANPVVKFNVSNFNVADGGSGDGYIKWQLDDVAQTDKTDTSDITFDATAGTTYKVYIELVDNNGDALGTPVNATVNFTINHPCDLDLASITTSCDALTSGTDTFNGSIDFTGGNTGVTYTITAKDGDNNDVGTIGGDDPSSSESGKITVTGVPEGTDVIVKIVGDANSSCDLSRTLFSPTCLAFPILEPFDFQDASNLGDQSSWNKLNSGDDITISSGSLEYEGLETSTGNKIVFGEDGSEAYTEFSNITSGPIYASFLLKVTGFQTNESPDLTDGGYIAALAGSTTGYDARFWVRPNPDTSGTTFDIGFGHQSSNPTFTSETYNLNDVLFVVMAYDMDSKVLSTWVNPDASSFGTNAPSATITSTDDNAPSAINLFMIRQDSDKETPFIELDEVRISTSWADVTPNDGTASVSKNSIEGFATYPNPVTNNSFTITSSSFDKKQISIYNVLGKKVLATNFSGTKSNIDVSEISSGIYILKVTENGKTATKKLVIR